MSFGIEVIADSSGKFCGNAVRVATRQEAEAYARHKKASWTLVQETRVIESADPVNYRWVNGQLESVP